MPKILQNNIKIQEIQSRLIKDSYLSREYLPTSIDAKIFLTLKDQDKMPNRQLYPNFFHWYIMMRQFAHRTLQIWLQKDQTHYAEDSLIVQLIKIIRGKIEYQRKVSVQVQNSQLSNIWNNNFLLNSTASVVQENNEDQEIQAADETETVSNSKLTSIQNINLNLLQPNYELYYIMDIKLKSKDNFCLQALKQKFVSEISLKSEKIQIIDMKEIEKTQTSNSQMLLSGERNQNLQPEQLRKSSSHEIKSTKFDQKQIRIVFKVDKVECEMLKNKVLSWAEVDNIKCKKEKRQIKPSAN